MTPAAAAPVMYGSTVRFGVLGPIEVTDSGSSKHLGGPKQRTVLALLLANVGRRTSTDLLVEGVYGDAPPPGARRSIQTYVSNLRGEVGDRIRREADGYLIDIERDSFDATRFEDLVAAARPLIVVDPHAACETLREALALWRGHPYDDIDGHGLIDPEVTRLSEQRLAALEARLDADLKTGRHADVVGELEALAAEYPYRERFHGQLMLALYRAGRQAEALRVYQRTRSHLVEELGIEPSPQLRELEQRILQHDESLDPRRRASISRRALVAVDVDPGPLAAALNGEARVDYLEELDHVVREAVALHGGEVFSERAMSKFIAFPVVTAALRAAEAILRDMPLVDGRVSGRRLARLAVDVGDAEATDDGGWTGPVVSRVAGLVGAAHGGQVLLSNDARAAAIEGADARWTIRGLGAHTIARLDREEPVHQLVVASVAADFPPLRTDSVPPALPGETTGLAGYELRNEIGRGLFGVVYRAYQPSVGREVAVKAISPEWASDADFIRRFELEAQLVARLEHPNIVPVYDYWRDPDGAFLVMRWIRGGNLKEAIASRPLSLPEASRLVGQVGAALAAAHRAGLVHCDVKASNVLVDADGFFYLGDFGIAAGRRDGGGHAGDIADLATVVRRSVGVAEALPTGAAAVLDRAESADVYSDVIAFMADWSAAVGAEPSPALFTPARNPYKGLDAFTEADAGDFHGRDPVVAELVATLAERRLVAAVGPSGIGKSSLARAGVVPQLRAGAVPGSERWLFTDMLPGRYPFEAFASALLRVAATAMPGLDDDLRRDRRGMVRAAQRLLPPGAEFLMLIDQFEELFTLADAGRRAAFLDALVTLATDPGSNARIAITLRADFFDRPLSHPGFGELMRAGTVPISAPTGEETRALIERPAAAVGVRFEAGLVERILGDVAEQPGALPLLEYTLTELFDAREQNELRVAGYDACGGVLGALGNRAEELYQELPPAAREAARDVFLRLVAVSDDAPDTRRRVRRTELERLAARRGAVEAVLGAFGQHRLLTFDRDPISRGPTVEVAHEALFREWDRLAGWIEETRADLALHAQLRQSLEEWQESGDDDAFLLAGGRLLRHESWVATTTVPLTGSEIEFLATGRDREDARVAARRRLRRAIVSGFAAATVVALTLAGLAFGQQRRAERERDAAAELRVEAEEQQGLADAAAQAADVARRVGFSRELALQAIQQLPVDPERSMLLALEAIEAGRSAGVMVPEATSALRRAMQNDRVATRLPAGGFVAVSPDGTLIATAGEQGGVALWDVATETVTEVLDRDGDLVLGAEFSPRGDRLAVLYAAVTPPMRIWDLTGATHVDLSGTANSDDQPPYDLSFSGDGSLVMALTDSGHHVWDAVNGDRLHIVEPTGLASFGPGGQLVVADADTGEIRILDELTGEETGGFTVAGFHPESLAASPDGSRLAVISPSDGVFAVYGLASGTEIARATVARPGGQLAWFADGGRVLVGGDAGVPRVFDAATGEALVELLGHEGIAWAVATSAAGDVAVSAGLDDGTTILWETDQGLAGEVGRLVTGVPAFRSFDYAGSGDALFVSGRPSAPGVVGTVRIVDAADAQVRLDLGGQAVGFPPEAHPVGGGAAIATAPLDGPSSIVAPSGETLYTAPPGLHVVEMSPAGDVALVAARTFADDVGEPRTEIVEVATGELVASLDEPEVAFAGFSIDGSMVWTWAGRDFAFYDTSSGEELLRLDVNNAAFMPGGKALAVIDLQGVLHLANLDMLRQGAELAAASSWQSKAHDTFTPILRAHPDGSVIMTAGIDEPVKVWNSADGSLLTELESGLSSGSARAQFHPERRHVTLLSDGGVLLTFTLDTEELVDVARSRLTRDLTDAECRTFLHLESCADRVAS